MFNMTHSFQSLPSLLLAQHQSIINSNPNAPLPSCAGHLAFRTTCMDAKGIGSSAGFQMGLPVVLALLASGLDQIITYPSGGEEVYIESTYLALRRATSVPMHFFPGPLKV